MGQSCLCVEHKLSDPSSKHVARVGAVQEMEVRNLQPPKDVTRSRQLVFALEVISGVTSRMNAPKTSRRVDIQDHENVGDRCEIVYRKEMRRWNSSRSL